METDVLTKELLMLGIPKDFVSTFIELGNLQKVAFNQTVVTYNDVSQNVFIVLKGGFVSQRMVNDGSFRTINFFLRGHEPYMSSFHSFFNGEKSPVQLKSIKKSTVLVLKKSEIDNLNHSYSEFKDFYIERLIHALLLENEFKSYLIAKTPLEIYNIICEKYPILIKELPSKYIAEFIGITRVWLSNLKHQNLKKR
ncbi:Crp/Fnr family transcriptional regulator [Aquimarina sediminis]|uniref:Crp/Fnr family transcriptional regulator n=1 Tax=Aquimarina sediminis TaxID=2070536 RepID=UPI000CA05FC8|nr:Crp/Fnr family transcriptional regulator [Aquimarina sediminis]